MTHECLVCGSTGDIRCSLEAEVERLRVQVERLRVQLEQAKAALEVLADGEYWYGNVGVGCGVVVKHNRKRIDPKDFAASALKRFE